MEIFTKILSSVSLLWLILRGGEALSCKSKCRGLFQDIEAEGASEACLAVRNVAPMPTVSEMCQGVFLATYKSVCLNLCDESNPVEEYDCPNIVRSSSVGLKQGLRACKLGREKAFEWVTSQYVAEVKEAIEEIEVELKKQEPETHEITEVLEEIKEDIEEIQEIIEMEREQEQNKAGAMEETEGVEEVQEVSAKEDFL